MLMMIKSYRQPSTLGLTYSSLICEIELKTLYQKRNLRNCMFQPTKPIKKSVLGLEFDFMEAPIKKFLLTSLHNVLLGRRQAGPICRPKIIWSVYLPNPNLLASDTPKLVKGYSKTLVWFKSPLKFQVFSCQCIYHPCGLWAFLQGYK